MVKGNEPEPVDMQEVNALMNEMSDFCNESEETSVPIEDSLAKTIYMPLGTKIPESKFQKIKSKYKRPPNCQNIILSAPTCLYLHFPNLPMSYIYLPLLICI